MTCSEEEKRHAARAATGFGAQETLYPARQLVIGPGPLEGLVFGADGSVLARSAVELDAPLSVSAYAVAVINGVEHVLIGDGELAGRWVAGYPGKMRRRRR